MCETCRQIRHCGLACRGADWFSARRRRACCSQRGGRQGEETAAKPQNVLSPDASLERLQKGNVRYIDGVSLRHDFKHEREALAGGQNPMLPILSCRIRGSRPNMPSTAAAAISSCAGLPATSLPTK